MNTTWRAALASTVLATAATLTAAAGPAGAALVDLQLAPASGHPGTAVTVTGKCTDFIATSVELVVATIPPPVLLPVPVGSGGKWQASFTVPPGALAGPAPVTATCLPLLGTSVQTFTVTSPPASTTTTPTTQPPAGDGIPSPTTQPPAGGGDDGGGGNPPSSAPSPGAPGSPGTTVPSRNGAPRASEPAPGGDSGDDEHDDEHDDGESAPPEDGDATGDAREFSPTAGFVEEGESDAGVIDGLSWPVWALFVLLVAGGIAALAWDRALWRREPRDDT